MNKTTVAISMLGCALLAGCGLRSSATPTPAFQAPLVFITTETPSPASIVITDTPVFTPTATPVPPINANFCADPQVTALIDSLKTSMLSRNGSLLSSLVSPNGMEVRYYHNSQQAVKYSAYQATFLFETTYVADWGQHPSNGQDKKGSFHDVIVPDLAKIFNQPYTLQCNEIRHGATSTLISWPYQKDFYSIYYAGSLQNSDMDWNTWVVGVEYVNAKPSIYALTQFFYEP